MREVLGEFLFRRLLGLTYAVAFASFLSMSDAIFACSGIVAVEPRFGVPVEVVFAVGVLGLCLSIALLAFNLNFTLLPLWLLFLLCNVMGTDLLFFREYDIFLLEVGLYAILFTGDIGKKMSSWALFRYCFSCALSFFSCAGGLWENLEWFKYAYTSVSPLNPAWHFATNLSPFAVKYATSFVMVAFLLSGLCVGSLLEAPRYVFWAGILYKGVVQNSAWIVIIFFALTTHIQSDSALLSAYSLAVFRNLGAVRWTKTPSNLAPDHRGIISSIFGFLLFCGVPLFLSLECFHLKPTITDDILTVIGACTLFLHILKLLRSRRLAGLLAGVLSIAGFAMMVPDALEKWDLSDVPIPGTYVTLGDVLVDMFRYAHPVECPEPREHRNIQFCGIHGEHFREDTYLPLHTIYSVADAESQWPISTPFAPRLEEAIVRVAKERPKETPRWLVRTLLYASIRDPNVGQFFEHAKFKDSPSVYGTNYTIHYMYVFDARRTTTSDFRSHTWWSISGNLRLLFPILPTKLFELPLCPPPNAWVGLPLLQISMTIVLVMFTGRIARRMTTKKR